MAEEACGAGSLPSAPMRSSTSTCRDAAAVHASGPISGQASPGTRDTRDAPDDTANITFSFGVEASSAQPPVCSSADETKIIPATRESPANTGHATAKPSVTGANMANSRAANGTTAATGVGASSTQPPACSGRRTSADILQAETHPVADPECATAMPSALGARADTPDERRAADAADIGDGASSTQPPACNDRRATTDPSLTGANPVSVECASAMPSVLEARANMPDEQDDAAAGDSGHEASSTQPPACSMRHPSTDPPTTEADPMGSVRVTAMPNVRGANVNAPGRPDAATAADARDGNPNSQPPACNVRHVAVNPLMAEADSADAERVTAMPGALGECVGPPGKPEQDPSDSEDGHVLAWPISELQREQLEQHPVQGVWELPLEDTMVPLRRPDHATRKAKQTAMAAWRRAWIGARAGRHVNSQAALRRPHLMVFECGVCRSLVQMIAARIVAAKAKREVIEPGDACTSRKCTPEGQIYHKQHHQTGQLKRRNGLRSRTQLLVREPNTIHDAEVTIVARDEVDRVAKGTRRPSAHESVMTRTDSDDDFAAPEKYHALHPPVTPSPPPSAPASPHKPSWRACATEAMAQGQARGACELSARTQTVARAWHVTHKAWNKLMHALHGNTTNNVVLREAADDMRERALRGDVRGVSYHLAAWTPWELVGAMPGDDPDQIRVAFRARMLAWHPDRNPDFPKLASEASKFATAAYDTLMEGGAKRDAHDVWYLGGLDKYLRGRHMGMSGTVWCPCCPVKWVLLIHHSSKDEQRVLDALDPPAYWHRALCPRWGAV